MNKIKFSLLLVLAASFVFWSCSKDESEDVDNNETKVMLVHASPNAPAVDVSINNNKVASNLSYPGNTDYIAINPGANNIKVALAGTSLNAIDTNINLTANGAFSIFAIDSVSKGKAVIVADNLTAPAAGKAHVRFFHFSPNAPAIDIAVAGGPVLFSNRSFNDQAANTSFSNFTAVDAGTYNFEVRPAGSSTVMIPVSNVKLDAGKIYTVFAKGFVGGAGTQAADAKVIVNK